jgi:hypothetical protein
MATEEGKAVLMSSSGVPYVRTSTAIFQHLVDKAFFTAKQCMYERVRAR